MKIKTVYIEITNRCNLNCQTCYNRSGLNRETKELSVAQIESFMHILSSYGARRFVFSGGEPSLHSEFHKLLRMMDRYPDFAFGFVTNGTNPDSVWIDYLNTRKKLTLQISLDGANENQNRLTRGDGHFERVVNFVKRIRGPEEKRLKMVVSQNNIDGIEDFYRLAISLDFTPEFAFIYKSGNGCEAWESKTLSPQQKLKVLKLVDKLNRETGINAFLPRCTTACPFAAHTEDMSVCVKADGSLQPCQILYDTQFTLGNMNNFDETAVMDRLARITETARARKNADFGCGKCLLSKVCGRGCMAEAFLLSNTPLGDDGDCMYRKLQFINFDIQKPMNPLP